jgi:hypothetical protein
VLALDGFHIPLTYGCPVSSALGVLHIKITHFDSVASVVITKVASVAFCSQGCKCCMWLTSVATKHPTMMPMLCL